MWRLAGGQHDLVTREQLTELGFSPAAIRHRVRRGRLHRVRDRVYAVGRPTLTREGELMAAVLDCGHGALLSHASAAEVWQLRSGRCRSIEVTVPPGRRPRAEDLRIHRRDLPPEDLTRHRDIPVTTPARTILDMAVRLDRADLERMVNEADKLDLIGAEALREWLDARPGQHGAAALRSALDRHTLVLTHTELERLFVPLAKKAGLPKPEGQQWLKGYRVDFYWRDLKLVVEVDGLRYHRTATTQASDRRKDQVHLAAGLTPLRFTYSQVKYEPEQVVATLTAVARRTRQ